MLQTLQATARSIRAVRSGSLHLPQHLYRCQEGYLLTGQQSAWGEHFWGGLILPGQIFLQSEASLLQALGPVELVVLDQAPTQAIQARLEHLQILLALTNLRLPKERVLGFLLYCGLQTREPKANQILLPFPLTQQHLAWVAKSNRFQVAEILRKLADEQLVVRHRQCRLLLPNLIRLQTYCPLRLT